MEEVIMDNETTTNQQLEMLKRKYTTQMTKDVTIKEEVDLVADLRTRLQNSMQLATELAQHIDRLESQRFNRLCNHPNLKRVTTNEREGGFTFWF